MIVIEDLQMSNMSKNGKGTIEAKGRNVKAKSGLIALSYTKAGLDLGGSLNTNRHGLAAK